MNWIAELCDLYEKNEDSAGKWKEDGPILLPPYHTTVTAQITVTIDESGNFLRAETVPEEDKLTIIPVTEKSASRTAGIEPHPLCDNLAYLAGDYGDYVTEKDCTQNHVLYMDQLGKWVDSPHSHKKAEAVYHYLQKDTLMSDLCKAGALRKDESGRISEKTKIQIVSQVKAFVRFRIETGKMPDRNMLAFEDGRYAPECWKDMSLQKSYIAYCRSQQDNKDLSYLTGDVTQISYLQPKKIRNEGDGAKLISANDESNYTFRGRFASKEEAFAIGYEDSQKAHNALKWIIRKQGSNYGTMCLVTWESNSKEVLDWADGSDEICAKAEELSMSAEEDSDKMADSDEKADLGSEVNPCAEDHLGNEVDLDVEVDLDNEVDLDTEADLDNEVDLDAEADLANEAVRDAEEGRNVVGKVPDTGEADAARSRRALQGYQKKLDMSSRTVIMAFDAATTGRLAMMEFKDYASSRYVEALQSWYERCRWIHQKSSKEKGRYTFVGMVGIKDAAELLYGTEQNGYFSLKGKEERYKDVAKRWMPCILEGREVPEDMVRLAVQRASAPMSFDSRFLWERILTLACSLVRQQYIAKRKGDWTMALDVTCTKRDYLYGRLLALADRIEYRTYDKGEIRQTNAKRYMSAFSQHPFRTWKVIEEKLEPYLMRLSVPERLSYQNLMNEICSLFTVKDYENDASLSGLYLLGFHNQAFVWQNDRKKEEN